jgi:hypothetical protein
MTFLDSEGRVMDPRALKKRIFYGGVEQKLRHVVFSWSLFTGFSNWQFDLDQISEYLPPLFCSYIGSSPNKWTVTHIFNHLIISTSLSVASYNFSFMLHESWSDVACWMLILWSIFLNLLLYSQVWKFLLGYYNFDSTHTMRKALVVKKREEYRVLKSQWQVCCH